MPGKVNQDWTDDAAFWDEAWADMEQRLEEKKRPGGVLLWTRGIVLGTLLLVGVVAAWALAGNEWGETRGPEPNKSIAVPAEVVPPSAVVAEQDQSNKIDEAQESPQISAVNRPSLAQSSPADAPVPQGKSPAGSAGTSSAPPSPSQREVGSVPQGLTTGPSSTSQQPASSTTVTPHTEENFRGNLSQNERLATPLSPLVRPTANLTYEEALPKARIQQKKQGLPIFVTATSSIAQGRTTPGFSLGLGTVISQKGRINFPVSIGYRRDFMRVGQGNSGRANDEAVGIPTADMVNNAIEPLRLTVGAEGTALTTSGLELSTGIQYRVSPRLSFGANLRTEYLLNVNGVINAIQDGENFEYTFNNRTASSLGLTGAFNNVSALNESSSGLSGNSAINRYRLRAGVQLKYRAFGNFSVVAGFTRIVTPTYGSDLLRVRPSQLQLGVLYWFR